jgi:hypothetical protein
MASTISAARAALYALLAANTYPGAAPQVTFGPPDAYEEPEVIAMLGVESPDEEAAALGAQRREEIYGLVVGVKAHDPAGTAATVDARGFALADSVRAAVHATTTGRTLSSTVRTAEIARQTTDGVQPADGGGWVIFIRLLVECRQRIT